jgi:serine/threonine-protein phosphatase Stp1
VADMVEEGTLSASRAEDHPMSHILSRAVGTDPDLEVDLVLGLAEAGDLFLICSDGLTKVFRHGELESWLVPWRTRNPESLVRALVDEANGRGGPDNVSVAVLAVGSDS